MNKSAKIISVLSHFIVAILSYFIPKKKDFWVFVSFQFYGKYSGNNKALFDYIHQNKQRLENYQVVYVTNNNRTELLLKELGLPVKYNRFFWLWPLLRAEIIFTDGIRRFIGFGNFKFIQLWHGTGFKNIGFAHKGSKNTWLQNYLLKSFTRKSILISATSNDDKVRKELSFKSKNVLITGSPRNDIFFSDQVSNTNLRKKILYAPTFRDTGDEFNAMKNDDWDKLNLLMKNKNMDFLIKRHPSDHKLKVPTNFTNILDVTDATEDIQTLLTSVDMLVTDYSGIVTDFVISGKPIIFYTYDFEEYIATNRTFFYDIKKVLPGPFVSTPEELILYLSDLSWFLKLDYKLSYDKFRDKFHKYLDGISSERVLNEVIKNVMKSKNKRLKN